MSIGGHKIESFIPIINIASTIMVRYNILIVALRRCEKALDIKVSIAAVREDNGLRINQGDIESIRNSAKAIEKR